MNSVGFPKVGVHRRKFLLESLVNISYNILEKTNGLNSLIVRCGQLSDCVREICDLTGARAVYTHIDIDFLAISTHHELKQTLVKHDIAMYE